MESYMSDSEEEEIKIEYYESYETDPLSENFHSNQINEQHNDQPITNDFVGNLNLIQQPETTWHKAVDSLGRYLCRYCDLTYSTVQTLRHHIKTKHADKATYLKNTISSNKRNKKIKCHVCYTRFKLLTDLEEHVKQSHDLENIMTSCNYCDATFGNVREMWEHVHLKHKKQISKIFTCTICGYRTVKKSYFNQHKNTHLQLKIYDCQYCDYKTNYSPNLTIHSRIHTNDKPYICDYENCSYHCSTKSALRSHQLKHNHDENMLYCDKCSYKTVYKQSLKKHLDSHRRNCIAIKL